MPAYDLVSHALCPYVQRAAIAFAEKAAPFTRTVIDLADKPDWFSAISPLGKVPLLLVDGEVLFESAAIVDYIDETVSPRLHPVDPIARARHRAWIEYASTLLADLWGLYTASDAAAYGERLKTIGGRLDTLETALGDGPYFAGTNFSLVDAAFAPAFRYFDVFERVVDLSVHVGRPKLTAWRRALSARPSVRAAVAPDYADRLVSYVRAQNGHLGRQFAQAA
jgi:glutathione S-transferase